MAGMAASKRIAATQALKALIDLGEVDRRGGERFLDFARNDRKGRRLMEYRFDVIPTGVEESFAIRWTREYS
jgi:hypothetical protein